MSEFPSPEDGDRWERDVLRKLAESALTEQRRARRWGIFFKSLTLLYLFVVLVLAAGWIGGREGSLGKHTALVDLSGVIEADSMASADVVTAGLNDAFEDKNTQGVILRINSPGGSPVQAHQINREIRRLRGKFPGIPLYAVVDDICASGGYYVAVAADEIYASRGSLIGSIGVLMDGFGFTGAMQKLGVERRLLTAGENKGFLDPFSPLEPKQREFAQAMLNDIHKQFIEVVREGRGQRLKETGETFSGLFWTGDRSLEMGLVDAIGDAAYVAREVVKAENIVDFTPRENLAERFAKRFGAALGEAMVKVAGAGRVR
ncbi:MAG: S49 family peptidase [Betaproteobacteria bacterium]|nr:S49 family peptidase [Betaproteobacteria bacterium]MBL8534051.1 S49 family peptidase [Betaproteobacteria bacterium]